MFQPISRFRRFSVSKRKMVAAIVLEWPNLADSLTLISLSRNVLAGCEPAHRVGSASANAPEPQPIALAVRRA